MDNHEEILDALTAFGKNPNPQEIPSVLEQYLNSVAKNGETLFPWSQLKPLILRKMELVILELRRNLASENIPTRPNVENVRFDVIHARIIDSLHKFNGAPFTIQRLCELLIDPKRHYKRSDKFMRGLEKNVLVVSTVDPFGRKVVSELGSKPVLNGILDINGSYPPRDTALSVPLPPVPGWVNTAAANRTMATGASAVDAINKTGSGNSLDALGKDSDGMVSNSLAVSGTQVFSDQGDPLAVQSEEVVEETVVTMDTGEVSSVVTDGGESLADRDMEGELGDDRDASSFSSSSSSSSEELSTSSDSIENNLRCSTSPLGMMPTLNENSTAVEENRPWAAFAQDMKQQQDDLGTGSISLSSSSNQPVVEENQSGVSSSSPHNTVTADASSSSSLFSSSSSSSESSETQPSLSSTSSTVSPKVEGEQEEENHISCITNQQTTTTSSSDQSNWQQASSDESHTADNNQSFGFDPTTSSEVTDVIKATTATTTDKLISSSTSSLIPTTTTTTDNSSNTTSSDVHTSSSVSTSNSAVVPQPPTYAQVVASSTTDKMSSSSLSPTSIQHISPYDSTIEPVPACDSVAGLERLVGSVEQSLSSSLSSASSSSSSSTTFCPSSSSSSSSMITTTSQNNSSVVTTSSLPESSQASMDSSCHTSLSSSQSSCPVEDGEPVTKRLRLSLDEDSTEKDCISTSSDSYSDQSQRSTEEQQQREGEDSGPVDSSSIEAGFQLRERSEEDIQMEVGEGDVTTGSASAEDEENKEDCVEMDLAGGSIDDDNHINRSDDVSDMDPKDDNSNTEMSTVSTTESDNKNPSPQIEDTE